MPAPGFSLDSSDYKSLGLDLLKVAAPMLLAWIANYMKVLDLSRADHILLAAALAYAVRYLQNLIATPKPVVMLAGPPVTGVRGWLLANLGWLTRVDFDLLRADAVKMFAPAVVAIFLDYAKLLDAHRMDHLVLIYLFTFAAQILVKWTHDQTPPVPVPTPDTPTAPDTDRVPPAS